MQIEGLTKRFGGVVASDAITLDIPRGEFHAIIGPNGAGKTTLIGQLAGEIAPQGGAIRFDGGDITALPADRRSQLGLARSFQITSLFRDFTALDNVALAVQAHAGHSFRFWRDARRDAGLRAPARAALERVGLGARADMRVDRLSHGEQRQLEIAMALATRPRLLLLDEPMAGMGPDEFGAHGGDAARAQRRHHHSPDRARHGGGVRARRPHHRAGLWPRHRLGRAGDDPRQCRGARGLSRRAGGDVMAEPPLLEVSDIETSYGQSQVLFGISLAIAPGEMVTLMGRNGMGKTTTVRSIMGLTPATAGSIRFAGEDIRGLPSYRVAQLGIGLVPEGRQIFPNLTTRENLVATAANRTAAASRGRSTRSGAVSAARRAAPAAWRTCCPAASSRCWRSAAR